MFEVLTCRKCGNQFPLVGDPDSARCPECGVGQSDEQSDATPMNFDALEGDQDAACEEITFSLEDFSDDPTSADAAKVSAADDGEEMIFEVDSLELEFDMN